MHRLNRKPMRIIIKIQFTLILLAALCITTNAQLKWPHGAKAAVCLTYDDALDGHLDVAIPQLDAAGLKGTFFARATPLLFTREWKNGGQLRVMVMNWVTTLYFIPAWA